MTVIRPNSVAGINSITVQSGNSLAVHKANGELIRTITSSSGVSTFSTLSVGTATTDNSAAKSINIGLGASIAQHNDNSLTFGTNGDPRITIDASGDFNVGSAATIKAGGNATFSGIVTAASFVGDGSGLTGAGPSLTGSTNNTIVTVTGANAIQGESTFTYDGAAAIIANANPQIRLTDTDDSKNFDMVVSGGNGFFSANSSGMNMVFEVTGSERLRIGSSGGLGISTDKIRNADFLHIATQSLDYTNATEQLMDGGGVCFQTIDNLAATGRAFPGIFWASNTNELGRARAGILGVAANGHDATDIVFLAKYLPGGDGIYPRDERMRITNGGRIGIGTDSPDHTFEVTQAGSSVATSRNGNSPQLLFKSNNVGQAAQIDVNESSGGGVFILKSKNTSGSLTERVTVTTEGIVEIDGHFCAGNPGNFGGVSSTQGSRITGQQGSHPACLSFDGGGSPTLEMGSTSGEAIIGSNSHSSSPINFKTGMGIATLSGGTTRFQISSNGNIGAPTGSNIYNASDERLKENMIDITDGLSKIEKLKPISFTWKEGWDANLEGKTEYGFGAQTTQAVDELLVQPFSLEDAELNGEIIKNPLRVNEKYIIPLLVKAVQELSAKVAALEGG